MERTHLFSGNALATVGRDGRVRLPGFVAREIAPGGGCGRLMFGLHEQDTCLTGYDGALRRRMWADLDRQRLAEEANGAVPEAHHGRARRMFGFAEEAEYDVRGRIALPALALRKAAIADRVLFVGTGQRFEIWNPEIALTKGPDEVRALARYRLEMPEEEDGR